MGRKKIQITRIQDERNRQITFSKRKAGLLKKAYELSILCDVEIAVIMITNQSKLYQYASSNMNSILIRYTEFKDPDESKTNADVLEDITKREKVGRIGNADDMDDEGSGQIVFTPGTQAHFHKVDQQFDQVLHQAEHPNSHQALPNTTPSPLTPSAVLTSKVPQAMPVSVPVSPMVGSTQQQHRQVPQQLGSAGSSNSPTSTLSPATPTSRGQRSPALHSGMPPPVGTPTRLQTLRNQTLKLHLPGSGRNYISLSSTGPHGRTPPFKEFGDEEGGEDSHTGRPQLRVVIPGQKGFVPREAPSSPPLVASDLVSSSEGNTSSVPSSVVSTVSMATAATSANDSLQTPIMSLTTPNILSSLPPVLSGISGDPTMGLGELGSASALVAFPVSIQPSSVTSGSTPGSNVILQAQNMGQPFLLTTPSSYNRGEKENPLLASHGSSPNVAGVSPSIRDLEQLKLQYDRIYQQISQSLQLQHQQQDGQEKSGASTLSVPAAARPAERSKAPSSEEQDIIDGHRFVNPSEIFTNSKEKSPQESKRSLLVQQASPPSSSTAGVPVRASTIQKPPALEESLVQGGEFDPTDVFVSPEGKRVALPASEENPPKRRRLEVAS